MPKDLSGQRKKKKIQTSILGEKKEKGLRRRTSCVSPHGAAISGLTVIGKSNKEERNELVLFGSGNSNVCGAKCARGVPFSK